MITISIGSSTHSIQEADDNWINQNVNGRRRDGVTVCVQVRVQENTADVALATPGCQSGFGGGRPPNALEQRIIELWNKLGLNTPGFTGGNVVAFVHQLKRLM
ncbi:MAG TPA: hypothetical protein VIV65_08535 [Gemmatimonadaceae bacterium]